ncbi:amidohydrolase family protein [Bosea sp. UNC402CLCol]|uniref:amidohydrolase family protein n=1 Tax=Bosea sp. UNC402CLCol TaxID=1510531 RepID=UPI0006892181|nr:amidohydrolase family protein [Bosea sp. UNC402CLCol]
MNMVMTLPEGACDCHVHVFGPPERYPFAPDRVYTPGAANEEMLLSLHRRLGMDRVVLVQPSPYGFDNARMLAALNRLGERARAVAVLSPDAPERELTAMKATGVSGLRLNVDTGGIVDPDAIWAALATESERCARVGWHTQILTRLSVIDTLEARMVTLPAPLVVDHFGRPDIDGPIDQPGFPALLRLLGTGKVWVKLSSIGRLCGPRPQGQIAPFIRALVGTRPDRLVWGSDWPHTGGGRGNRSIDKIEPFSEVDDQASLAALSNAIGDRATLHRILVDNPARLYGFQL